MPWSRPLGQRKASKYLRLLPTKFASAAAIFSWQVISMASENTVGMKLLNHASQQTVEEYGWVWMQATAGVWNCSDSCQSGSNSCQQASVTHRQIPHQAYLSSQDGSWQKLSALLADWPNIRTSTPATDLQARSWWSGWTLSNSRRYNQFVL